MGLIAYFDCPTGISGDMCLGALVSAGVPLEYLMEKLALLGLGHEYRLTAGMVQKQGQAATKVEVHLITEQSSDRHSHDHHSVRHLPEIEQLIKTADLPARVSQWSLAIFHQLAIAEGKVHGIEPEQVHFHEVGATDAIVDIVGTCLGLDYLGVDQCYWSALPTGSGTVRAAHGDLPVPVPAVLRLWETRQVPVYDNGLTGELVTPTGAAIAVTLASQFGTKPPLNLQKVGLGAGSKDLPLANILRLWIGEKPHTAKTSTEIPFGQLETITVLETQLDDIQPQAVGYLLESLLHQGAIDVFTQALAMKKSRPGILLTVLCAPENQNHCLNLLFRETTSLGVRVRQQQRYALEREWQTVVIAHGSIRIKVAYSYQAGKKNILNAHPEFVDCAALAKATGQPWQLIHQQAIAAWSSLSKESA